MRFNILIEFLVDFSSQNFNGETNFTLDYKWKY